MATSDKPLAHHQQSLVVRTSTPPSTTPVVSSSHLAAAITRMCSRLQRMHLLLVWSLFVASAGAAPPSPIDMGTTLVAIKYQGGVVVAADSRTSVSGYVSNRYAYKITPVNENCVLCRSGSAADTQQIAWITRLELLDRSYRYGMKPTISQVAHCVRSFVYGSSGSVSLLVAGYDQNSKEGCIWSVSQSGALLEEDVYAVSGSGSSYIIGHLDHNLLQPGKELSEDDAVDFCKQAIELAMNRDGSSGGLVRILVLNAKGSRTITVFPSTASNSVKKEPENLLGFAPPEYGLPTSKTTNS
jgi:20S proteasome subunit beta 1